MKQPDMKHKILNKLGFTLNEMQQTTYDTIIQSKQDVLLLSPTGSGKSLAFLLPLAAMLRSDVPEIQAIVVVPSRELALQLSTVWKNMGTGMRTLACYGGRPAMEEHKLIRVQEPQIIFATPGRLLDHLNKNNILTGELNTVVIDEFDKCCAMGFQREMEALLELTPIGVRKVLVSATPMDSIPDYVGMKRVKLLDFLSKQPVSDNVRLRVVRSGEADKLPMLARLLNDVGEASSIVFLNHRNAVERVTDYLTACGFSAVAYHGGYDQHERELALYRFSNHSVCTMVCTDLGSRGLDVPQLDHVIHYHLPVGEKEMIHRIGRTARWDATGTTWFILAPEEDIPTYVAEEVEECKVSSGELMPQLAPMCTLYIGKGKQDKISKGDILGFLCKNCGLKAEDIGRIDVWERYGYVAVKRACANDLLHRFQKAKIKGISTKIELIK